MRLGILKISDRATKAQKEFAIIKELAQKHIDVPPNLKNLKSLKRFESKSGRTVYSCDTSYGKKFYWGFDEFSNPIKSIERTKSKFQGDILIESSKINHKKNVFEQLLLSINKSTSETSITKVVERLIKGKKAEITKPEDFISFENTLSQEFKTFKNNELKWHDSIRRKDVEDEFGHNMPFLN
ncbi:MAG: hypothetical protein WCY19_04135 [Candidatus Gastranaerophilaceae bacterium]